MPLNARSDSLTPSGSAHGRLHQRRQSRAASLPTAPRDAVNAQCMPPPSSLSRLPRMRCSRGATKSVFAGNSARDGSNCELGGAEGMVFTLMVRQPMTHVTQATAVVNREPHLCTARKVLLVLSKQRNRHDKGPASESRSGAPSWTLEAEPAGGAESLLQNASVRVEHVVC